MKHKDLIITTITVCIVLLVLLKSMIVTNGGMDQGYKSSDLASFRIAKQWIIYSIDSDPFRNKNLSEQHLSTTDKPTSTSEKTTTTEEFHGYAVLKQLTVPVTPELVSVIRDLDFAGQHWNGGIAKCFNPRHAARVIEQGVTYDLLICYECKLAYIYRDETKIGTIYFSTNSPNAPKPDQLNSLLHSKEDVN